MRERAPEASAGIPNISQRMWITISSALAALGLVEPGAQPFWRSSPSRVLQSLQASRNFRESAGNSFYSIAEYIAQPVSMLVAAPFLVHRLGLPQYGIWMLASAILGSMGILSTGFGDATVKYVSAYRGQGNQSGIERTIRATLSINTLLGAFFGLLVWASAPYAVDHLFKIEPVFRTASLQTIRISAVILVLRSIESVFVSTLRAFERYGPPVKLNVFLRIIVVASAVVLAAIGSGVAAIMIATLFWSALIVVLQVVAARRVVGSFKFSVLVALVGCRRWPQSCSVMRTVSWSRRCSELLHSQSTSSVYRLPSPSMDCPPPPSTLFFRISALGTRLGKFTVHAESFALPF